MLWLIFSAVAFILLSGVMAAVDAAILSVTRPEIEELILEGKRGATRLKQAKLELTRTVVVIVILTNTVNVLGPILVSHQAFELYGPTSIGVVTAVLALGTIVFSEILPKALGSHYAPIVSRLAAPGLRILQLLLLPLVVGLSRLSQLFLVRARRIGTEQQIRSLVSIGRRAGFIESGEGLLIHRAFVLNDRTAADIMTPLNDVIAFRDENTVEAVAEQIRTYEFSRYPVFAKSPNDFRGIILARDILGAMADQRGSEPIAAFIRPGIVVESSRRSDSLLAMFRDRRMHLAAVQQDGSIIGIVTLEDVLEELVGEIEDEKDVAD